MGLWSRAKWHTREFVEFSSHGVEAPHAGVDEFLHRCVSGCLIKYPLTLYASCAEVEQTGASSQFYDKFSTCRSMTLTFVIQFSF